MDNKDNNLKSIIYEILNCIGVNEPFTLQELNVWSNIKSKTIMGKKFSKYVKDNPQLYIEFRKHNLNNNAHVYVKTK